MNFISILKKVGQEVNAFDGLIPVYGPAIHGVTALIPGKADADVTAVTGIALDGMTKLQNIILDVEAFGQAIALPGTQKAIAAGPAVNQLLMDSLSLVHGKKPKDIEKTKADAANVAAAVAQYMNGYE